MPEFATISIMRRSGPYNESSFNCLETGPATNYFETIPTRNTSKFSWNGGFQLQTQLVPPLLHCHRIIWRNVLRNSRAYNFLKRVILSSTGSSNAPRIMFVQSVGGRRHSDEGRVSC